MECNHGFTAQGEVNLRGAQVSGLLTFRNATLTAPPMASHTMALHLTRLQAGELSLRTAQPIAGDLGLAQAQVGALDDDPAVWPAAIWLNGFTYDTIRHHTGRIPVTQRIDWVS